MNNSPQKVRKAVIPVAGLGTRFLPVTKSTPKELLPIVDVPTIQLIVQEAVDAGIETIVFVTAKNKDSILDHFDHNRPLEEKLRADGKEILANHVSDTAKMAEIVAVRQGEPLGLGHAVLQARGVIGDEPFIVMLGDDIIKSETPCCAQLIATYEKYRKSVVALMEVSDEDVSSFGIAAGREIDARNIDIEQMVEKPELKDAPSKTAIVGRYLFEPEIFKYLAETQAGKGGEIQLTDAMESLRQSTGFIGHKFTGQRFDAGNTLGFVQANIAYALDRPEISERLMQYLKQITTQQ